MTPKNILYFSFTVLIIMFFTLFVIQSSNDHVKVEELKKTNKMLFEQSEEITKNFTSVVMYWQAKIMSSQKVNCNPNEDILSSFGSEGFSVSITENNNYLMANEDCYYNPELANEFIIFMQYLY